MAVEQEVDNSPGAIAQRLDALRNTKEYREWLENWRGRLASYTAISEEYLRTHAFNRQGNV